MSRGGNGAVSREAEAGPQGWGAPPCVFQIAPLLYGPSVLGGLRLGKDVFMKQQNVVASSAVDRQGRCRRVGD